MARSTKIIRMRCVTSFCLASQTTGNHPFMGDLGFLLPDQKEGAMELMPRSTLPETGFLRLPQIVGDSKAKPPVPALIPVSRSTWWAGVKSGRYPRPVKLGPRITAWRVEDIRIRNWRKYQSEDKLEVRNPGGYLNTLCATLVIPDWYAPPEERQIRAHETWRRQEVQAAGLVAQQMAEEIENKARDQLWQSLNDTERDRFCTVARDEYPVGTHAPEGVVQILAKMKAWNAQQVGGGS